MATTKAFTKKKKKTIYHNANFEASLLSESTALFPQLLDTHVLLRVLLHDFSHRQFEILLKSRSIAMVKLAYVLNLTRLKG